MIDQGERTPREYIREGTEGLAGVCTTCPGEKPPLWQLIDAMFY